MPLVNSGLLAAAARPAVKAVVGGYEAELYAGAARVKVPSRSRPGEFHTVRVEGGRVSCDCRGFQYRSECWATKEISHLIRMESR